eukprot:4405584-Prymnesium_polylepis.1
MRKRKAKKRTQKRGVMRRPQSPEAPSGPGTRRKHRVACAAVTRAPREQLSRQTTSLAHPQLIIGGQRHTSHNNVGKGALPTLRGDRGVMGVVGDRSWDRPGTGWDRPTGWATGWDRLGPAAWDRLGPAGTAWTAVGPREITIRTMAE